MTDPVKNPSHYNQNGIEVIDVIETYAKTDFRLANVIKYVCRCEYKGNKLQDLAKAQWYLDRVIDELEGFADLAYIEEQKASYSMDEAIAFIKGYDFAREEDDEDAVEWDAYGRVFRASPPVNIDGVPFSVDEFEEFDSPGFYIPEDDDEVDYSGTPAQHHHEFVSSLATRIAGEDETAQRIKDNYYGFDRYEILGYCANCDAEIAKGQPYVKSEDFDADLKFCKHSCIEKLREWQGR